MSFPVTLNGRTYTLTDFEGTKYVEGFPDALEDFVTHAGNTYRTTSTTSVTLGTGSKTFTTADSGKPYASGTPLRISSQADETDFIDALVTSYSGTTLVVNAVGFSGSGTLAAWNINIGGGPNTVSGTLPINQGGTGATTASAAATALGLGTGDSPTFAGLTTTGNINFGDNDKAVFGGGSDLQIFHDAGHSRIVDAGTGNLRIQADDLRLQSADGVNNYITADNGGAATLYHNALAKLATTSTGVDVTGTVTADAFLSGDNTGSKLDFNDDTDPFGGAQTNYTTLSSVGGVNVLFDTNNNDSAGFLIASDNASSSSATKRLSIEADGDISFFADNGTTQGFYWDASTQRLGLGTTSPSARLEVNVDTFQIMKVKRGTSGTSAGIITFEQGDGTAVGHIGGVGSSGGLQLRTGTGTGTERMRIDSSGNVGIGTVSPDRRLQVRSDENDQFNCTIGLAPSTVDTVQGGIGVKSGGIMGFNAVNTITFGIGGTDGDGASEVARIDTSGNLLVGTTSADPIGANTGNGRLAVGPSSNESALNYFNATGGACLKLGVQQNTSIVRFFRNTASVVQVGDISVTTTSTSYNESSDYRLKENVVAMTGAIDRVKAMAPKRFNFIVDPDTTVDGFIAHEAATVVPEAVTGTHNEVDGDGNPVYQGIDKGKLVPLLTGALQEAIAKIETLETEMTALKARVTTLEAN